MTVLNLNGSVVTDEDKWFYDFLEIPSISPSDLTQALESDEEIVLNVNSPGGRARNLHQASASTAKHCCEYCWPSVFSGFSFYHGG